MEVWWHRPKDGGSLGVCCVVCLTGSAKGDAVAKLRLNGSLVVLGLELLCGLLRRAPLQSDKEETDDREDMENY